MKETPALFPPGSAQHHTTSAPSLFKLKMEIALVCREEVRINERAVLAPTSLQTTVMTPNDSPSLLRSAPDFQITPAITGGLLHLLA